jgi:hypothetical protein
MELQTLAISITIGIIITPLVKGTLAVLIPMLLEVEIQVILQLAF